MRAAAKKYDTWYKKIHLERDRYLPLLDPKSVIQGSGCGAFHHVKLLTDGMQSGVWEQLKQTVAKKKFARDDVTAGQEYVKSYVKFYSLYSLR
jgi:hypothetical protein